MVYAHYASHTALPILLARLFRKNLNIVTNVHGNDVIAESRHDEKFVEWTKRLLRVSNIIICPSTYYSHVLQEEFDVIPQRIKVFPSGGVDTQLFRPIEKNKALQHLNLNGEFVYIGYISRIEEKKGWDLLLLAFSELAKENSNLRLIVVGDGAQINKYLELISKLGIESKIFKYELLPQEELVYVFNALDVFVFPTYRKSESLGLVGLEAMACETLTILPDKYGPASYGKSYKNSISFESGDEKSLRNAIQYALTNDCDKIKHNGRLTSLEYDRTKVGAELFRIFDRDECGDEKGTS